MTFVLGVRGIPRGEVELLRCILRLSSDLLSRWTVSESHPGDLLLVQRELADADPKERASQVVVVPLVPRDEAPASPGLRLCRPIYAEELVKLLNDVGVAVIKARPPVVSGGQTEKGDRARLKRWPSQAVLLQRREHIRLATVLTRGAHSAATLGSLTGIDTAQCAHFLDLLDREGLIEWQHAAPAQPTASFLDTQPGDTVLPSPRKGLMARIRRRLGLT